MPRTMVLVAAAIAAFLIFGSMFSCERKEPAVSKKETKIQAGRPVFPSPLMVYIQEKKYQIRQARQQEIQAMQDVYVSRKDAVILRKDFVQMHGLLKDGVSLFRDGKLEESLQEFQRVVAQHPEDAQLVCLATKNMAVVCKKLDRKEEYLLHFKKYYDLLLELPEDEDEL